MLNMNYVGEYDTYEVEFDRTEHVVTLKGSFPVKATGFYLSQLGKRDDLDYTAFNTVYREIEGGAQFSDDGSTWVEPTHDVTVQVTWNDGEDIEGLRPDSVLLTVNGESVIFKASEDWKKVYKDLKESETVVINSAEAISGYEVQINGTGVIYTHEIIDPTPTLEDRVYDLEIAVCEIADAMG